MAIQWYPGHMHKAQKQIKDALPQVDLVIEVLDARIPFSSENPLIAQLRGDKPCIKVLSKSDLADPEATRLWQDYLEREKGVKTLALTTQDPTRMRQLTELCRKMLPAREQSFKAIHTMIVGIPNVGKSTLINTLAGKTIAKTGNEPAVTKSQQRINLGNGIVLSDTPGILWPKVEIANSSYRLATSGAIKDTAMSYDDVAFFCRGLLDQTLPTTAPGPLSTGPGAGHGAGVARSRGSQARLPGRRRSGQLEQGLGDFHQRFPQRRHRPYHS